MSENSQDSSENKLEQERTILDVLSDIGEGAIDGLARTGRVSGMIAGGLQGGFNTDSYQLQKARIAEEYAQMQRAQSAYNLAQKKALLGIESDQMKNEEYKKNSEIRETLRKNALAQARNQYKATQMGIIQKNLRTRLETDPKFAWNEFNTEEQKEILSDPDIQNVANFNYIARELLKSRNDPDSWQRIQDIVEEAGGVLHDDGKGNYSVDLFGRNIPLNEQSVLQLDKIFNDTMSREIEARRAISYKATRGNVVGKIYSDRVKELIPYTGGSAVKASEVVQKTIAALPMNQRITMFLNRTLSDYYDPSVTGTEKMQQIEQAISEDQSGMSLLSRLGFTYNAGTDRPDDAQIIDVRSKKIYSLPEFMQYLKENDEAKSILDLQFKTIKENYETKQKQALMKTISETGRALFSNDENNEDQQDLSLPPETIANIYSRYGDSYLEIPEEKLKGIGTAEAQITAIAMRNGYMTKTEDGKFQVNPDITNDQITQMKGLESKIFEKNGLEKLGDKGFWHQMKEKKNAENDEKTADKRELAIQRRTEIVKELLDDAKKNPIASPGLSQTAGNLMMINAISRLLNIGKKEDAQKRQKKAEKSMFGGK